MSDSGLRTSELIPKSALRIPHFLVCPRGMLGDKLRFRFRKVGDLRLLSHHDLMRCLERMLRRAAIPFKSTAGFHPGPRLVFALSLPLGVVARDEVLEL